MKFEVYRYTLASRASLNATTGRREFPGALIRDSRGGVGCLHPWPELGDLELEYQLQRLTREEPTDQTRCTLDCIELDGAARTEGRSLFEDLEIPRSHFTAGGLDTAAPGFDRVKLKMSGDLTANLAILTPWLDSGAILRLDFNLTGSSTLLAEMKSALGEKWERVEFIEDPFPQSPDTTWSATQTDFDVAFAADRERCDSAEWAVYKPAVDRTIPIAKNVITTSYMDHAIGQLWAAYRAATQTPDAICGLLTHPLFEPDPFFDRLSISETRLQSLGGTGLGFDDLLDDLPWTPLT